MDFSIMDPIPAKLDSNRVLKKIMMASLLVSNLLSGYALAGFANKNVSSANVGTSSSMLKNFHHKNASLPANGGFFPSVVSGTLDQSYDLKTDGVLNVTLSCEGEKNPASIVLHYSKASKELFLYEVNTKVAITSAYTEKNTHSTIVVPRLGI